MLPTRLPQLLFLVLVASCANVPSDVLFRCEPDGSCPSSNLRCVAIDGEKYCVPLDGGATAGGSAAGGSTAGGSAGGSTAGGSAGGSTAGGSAGGSTAGGAAGGSTAGGAAGGSSAGGAAGGSTAGGAAGGSTAGGSAGGSTAGGSTAGGAAGGSTAGGSAGGSTAGGSAGGSTAGGSAGGSTAGGAAGGMPSDGGALVMVLLPNSRFIGITQLDPNNVRTAPAIATVREPIDGGSSTLEGWLPNGSPLPSQTRVISWSSDYRVTAIASNLTDTAIAVRNSGGISVELVLPMMNFASNGFINLESSPGPDAGVSRLSMLPASSTAPVLAFLQGSSPTGSARLYRTGSGGGVSLSYTPMSMVGVAWGDDVIDSGDPRSSPRILVTARCSDACTLGGSTVTSSGPAARFAWVSYPPAGTTLGMPTTHSLLVDSFSMPVFSASDPVRVAGDGNNFVYFAGQGPVGELVVERRAKASGMRDGNLLSSTGALRLIDIRRSPNAAAVVLLATYQSSNVSFGSTVLPYTTANQRNVVVIRIDEMLGVTSTAFNVPGDQQAVGFAGGGSGFLHIAINQGPNAVLWRIPEP